VTVSLQKYTDDPIIKLLESFSGRKIHYFPNIGNAGDGYIAHSTYQLFDEYGINYITHKMFDDVRDSIVVIGGGGNLVEGKYTEVSSMISRLSPLNERLIILPSTIVGFGELLKAVSDNSTVYARERASFNNLLDLGLHDSVYLSHDLSLFTKLVVPAELTTFGQGKLKVYRTDSEVAGNRKLDYTASLDISLSWNGDLWQDKQFSKHVVLSLCAYIAPYRQVETDRLHIAILAGQLGKEVTLLANSYFKNAEVYIHSLKKHFPEISFSLAGP